MLSTTKKLADEIREALEPQGTQGVSTDPVDLLAYSHDTFPLALKPAGTGSALYMPDVVAFPSSTEDVAAIVRIAAARRVPIVPYGGGSGIVGGALPVTGGIMLDLKRLAVIGEIDTISRLVTVGAGANGQRLEDHLNERGYTTGHYPQSLRSSTVGGWIAHRAIGTASTRYGGIESMVAGMQVVLPGAQVLELRPSPRESTGPDLRQLFLGSEGTLGIVTRATLRLWPLPESRRWLVFAFEEFEQGLGAIRAVVQRGLRPAVVRLYDRLEGAHILQASGIEPGMCLLLLSSEGFAEQVEFESGCMDRLVLQSGGKALPPGPAERWWEGRFNTRGLLLTLQKPLGIADALEVSAPWRDLGSVYRFMLRDMTEALRSQGGEAVVFGHTSHAYPDGANLYMIFHGEAASPEGVAELYHRTLEAAFRASTQHGSLSHHHGVGLGKKEWMPWQYGQVGLDLLRSVQRAVDPFDLLNPGKLGA